MDKEKAQEIISKYQLIPGKLSRKILLAIENDTPLSSNELPEEITIDQINNIKDLYKKKIQKIGAENSPRNFVFYQLIKDTMPDFSWNSATSNENHAKKNILINAPRIQNLRPSLLSLLLNRASPENDSVLHRKYSIINKLPSNVINIIADLMQKIDVLYPSQQNMEIIVNWLKAALTGEEVTIFSPICPDYSVEPTGNPECPYKHTFNDLGSGLGLIAQRVLAVLPILIESLNNCGIKKMNIIIGLGDFEAYSKANLKRLKINKNEFLNRLTQSKNAFIKACSVSAKVLMITDMFGGYESWFNSYEKISNTLIQNNFGKSKLTNEKLIKIVRKRKSLYDRWYGEKTSSEHVPQLLNQGAEYAVIGELLSQYKNCLVLGADNDAMGPFYSVSETIPTLYLKRYYC